MDRPLTPNEAPFPGRLARTPDAPQHLYCEGRLPPDDAAPWVGVVGARSARGSSCELAQDIAASVADAGGVVVSGGALGVDAAAHRGALRAGGPTVVVMGAGQQHRYPAVHRPLFEAILNEGGALVTPYAPAVPPRRYHFVRRNRILAGLCDLVVVLEADRSSGSLYTAKAALDYDRKLAAVAGSPGCEALIAGGAFPLSDAAEAVAFARDRIAAPAPLAPTDELERKVLRSLGPTPTGAEELAAQHGWSARDVDRALVGLELARLALALPGRAYVRSSLGEAIRS